VTTGFGVSTGAAASTGVGAVGVGAVGVGAAGVSAVVSVSGSMPRAGVSSTDDCFAEVASSIDGVSDAVDSTGAFAAGASTGAAEVVNGASDSVWRRSVVRAWAESAGVAGSIGWACDGAGAELPGIGGSFGSEVRVSADGTDSSSACV
jgi:hypothetical protein